jgi:HEAT repeat protein
MIFSLSSKIDFNVEGASGMRNQILFVVLLSSSVTPALAAIQPSREMAPARPGQAMLQAAAREALSLPLESRLEALKRQGPNGYKSLVQLMADEKMPMEIRWRAVTAIGRIGGKESRPELERALNGKDWFMRNAGLVAMAGVDQAEAARWARRLLSDKALIVRAAAVDTLAGLEDKSSTGLLWEKLYAKENFKGKQSLFIRRRIVETLGKLEGKGREAKFIEVLGDRDEDLHVAAITALERISGMTLGTAKDPLHLKRERWEAWWSENGRSPAGKKL